MESTASSWHHYASGASSTIISAPAGHHQAVIRALIRAPAGIMRTSSRHHQDIIKASSKHNMSRLSYHSVITSGLDYSLVGICHKRLSQLWATTVAFGALAEDKMYCHRGSPFLQCGKTESQKGRKGKEREKERQKE